MSSSNISFWLKHILLAVALIVLAGIAIFVYEENESAPIPEGAKLRKTPSKGLTEFYTDYRLSSTAPHEDNVGDFVMEVNTPSEPMDERLRKMESTSKSSSNGWVGEHKFRSFKAGTTLRESITNFAQSEGMQVFWELDQDFIVKNHFQMDDTITGSLHKIARAIDSNFEGEVVSYFCPKHRTLVITAKVNKYLRDNCSKSNP